ncbi:hypothetical protein TNCV_1359791 [Trichonephila clavipes]|nr:hypothetical protein TNCV_1359791 [Trichonephila clavipes]
MVQYKPSSCKELGNVPSSLNSDSVYRDMTLEKPWNEPDVHVRRSHFVEVIYRDHLGIVENRGNGEFDGHWLTLVTLA